MCEYLFKNLFLIKSKKKNLAIKKTPRAPIVPPTIDITPPIHVPNRKPLIIDNKEANGKLHIIKKLYERITINIETKKFCNMKFCIISKLEKNVWSWKKSLFKKYIVHKINIIVNRKKINNFFDKFTRLEAFLMRVKLN